jgi:hypothetical protein
MNQQFVENFFGFYFQHSNTVLLLISVLVVMIAAQQTANQGGWIGRTLVICGAAIIVFFFSLLMTGITSTFYLNLAVEFLSALIAAILLDEWISERFYVFVLLVFVPVGIAIILLDFMSGTARDVLLNLSTDLLGSFLIFVLVRGSVEKKSLYQKKDAIRVQREQLEQQRQLDTMLVEDFESEMRMAERRRGQLDTQLDEGHEIWKSGVDYCDTIFEIKCASEKELKAKLRQIKKTVEVIYVERMMQSSQNVLYYYVFGKIK